MSCGKRRCSDRLFSRAVKLRRVCGLHSKSCEGTENDVEMMREALDTQPQLLEHHQEGEEPPLISAVMYGHTRCVEFLLEEGASVESLSSLHCNALVSAFLYIKCSETKRNIAALLLKSGSDPNSTINVTDDSMSLFVYLIGTNAFEFVELFLKLGADPNSVYKSINGNNTTSLSCLSFAVSNDFHNIVELLLKYGAETDKSKNPNCDGGINLIFIAIKLGKLKSLKQLFLYSKGIEIHEACTCCENVSFVNVLLKSDANFVDRIKMLKMVHKFGCNLWKNDVILEAREEFLREDGDFDEEERALYLELEKLRNTPLSLRSLSRLAIMRTMGRQYAPQSSNLEVPATLHEFLQFSELET